jgi:Sporulation factor SpoIIGA.
MEIYLDIVYLLNAYIGMLCILSLAIIQNQSIPTKRLFRLSMSFGLVVACLYLPYAYLFFFLWIIWHSWLVDQKHWFKMIIFFLFLYYTYTTSFFLLGQEVMFRGPILIVGTSFSWLYVLLLGTMVILLYMMMLFGLRKEVLKSGLYYQVIVVAKRQTMTLRGFLDTGNEATYNGLPVLFTSSLAIQNECSIEVARVMGNVFYKAMLVDIYWNGEWKKAYLAKAEDMVLKDADILLNLGLF